MTEIRPKQKVIVVDVSVAEVVKAPAHKIARHVVVFSNHIS